MKKSARTLHTRVLLPIFHFIVVISTAFTCTYCTYCTGFIVPIPHKAGIKPVTNLSARSKSSKDTMMSSFPSVEKKVFGMVDDQPIHEFIISNRSGMKARVMEFGAILISLHAPDTSGNILDLTHGFDKLEEWVKFNSNYFGATIGRFGNRIAHGRFTLGDSKYELGLNNEPGGVPCSLHGGAKGFNNVVWRGTILDDETVEFCYTSIDGEEGYPGTVNVNVKYSLNDENELKWEVSAVTDATTVINVVHHSYWNLSGDPTQPILDHILQLNAPRYLPTNEGLIPTGEIAPVRHTPMDFTTPHVIRARIEDDFEALRLGGGYDHCWVLDDNDDGKIQLAARVEDPQSGRVMEVFTDQPGVQFYTSNFLDGSIAGKGGIGYAKHTALCLETQRFPNSPNQPDFPSCILNPGEMYTHTLIHRFSTKT